MGRLPGLLGIPRLLRHIGATGAGLPADDELEFDAPDPRVRAACEAVREGRFGPAEELLAATREAADWGLRTRAARALAEVLLDGPGRIEAWSERRPGDRDVAIVRAEAAVAQAWAVRTGARASEVSAEQFEGFRALLTDAVPVLDEAVALNEGDPTPWVTVLAHDTGSAAPLEDFQDHLAGALALDPHNWAAHARAVQFLAAKWYGSHEEMFAHAERAAAASPPGHPLRGLPVVALSELALDERLDGDAATKYGPLSQRRVDAAVAAARALSESRPAGDPELAVVRNHLVWALIRDGRPAVEILDAFRAVGRHVTPYPWSYLGGLSVFTEFRSGVRAQVAQETPFFGGTVGPPRPDEAAADAGGARRELALVPTTVAQVTEAVLLTGVTYRMAPLKGRTSVTVVETAPSQEPRTGKRGRRPGLRRALLGEGDLVRLARSFTTGEPWPVLVVSRFADRYGLSLVRDRTVVATHYWQGPDGIPTQEEAAGTAAALVSAFRKADERQVAAALRDPGTDRAPVDAALAALRLPALPEGYGERYEVLADDPRAKLVTKRSLRAALRESLRDDPADPARELPPLGL
ncbi:hypothetical protein [Streptomyces solicathayae]|uniref:Uncharacterized protein n=1 Tax=Streptomyces solicathayae TaxID=3081768 RepID=A0ABZ0M2R6_9ACTN|nr:hypothetical protein [Streptomyces sp. HUAS YS2]WOX25877.1 hypothetical protein R2D22_32650 [Streptomyces sp. HUAS YS2]